MEYGAPSPVHSHKGHDLSHLEDGSTAEDGASTVMEDGSTTHDGSTIFSAVKLTTKERGYDDAFEEMKRTWEMIASLLLCCNGLWLFPPKPLPFFWLLIAAYYFGNGGKWVMGRAQVLEVVGNTSIRSSHPKQPVRKTYPVYFGKWCLLIHQWIICWNIHFHLVCQVSGQEVKSILPCTMPI